MSELIEAEQAVAATMPTTLAGALALSEFVRRPRSRRRGNGETRVINKACTCAQFSHVSLVPRPPSVWSGEKACCAGLIGRGRWSEPPPAA